MPEDYTIEDVEIDKLLKVDFTTYQYPAAIEHEEHDHVMRRVLNIFVELLKKDYDLDPIKTIVLKQEGEYEYDNEQTEVLKEIALIYFDTSTSEFMNKGVGPACEMCIGKKSIHFRHIVNMLLFHPIQAYSMAIDFEKAETARLNKVSPGCRECQENFIYVIRKLLRKLDETSFITIFKPHIDDYREGTTIKRLIYATLFNFVTRPDFISTKLKTRYPTYAEELMSYKIGSERDSSKMGSLGVTNVKIFSLPESVQYLYHIMPPEFMLSEEKYELLHEVKEAMLDSVKNNIEPRMIDPLRARQETYEVASEILHKILEARKERGLEIRVNREEIKELIRIAVRYTVGYGLIEVLLADPEIQDVSINSPLGSVPIFIVHGILHDCTTNIWPTLQDAEAWASRLRTSSGRPLNSANPILDTGIHLPDAAARVSVIQKPLDPTGFAFSFRRHKSTPWTFGLFIDNDFMTSMAAGVLSFIIDGTRTMLIVGTRSSGKTSLLGSVLVEILRRIRIITIEDTLELPVPHLIKLNYNIQQMKVASALAKGSSEVDASDGIRATLRLGDSALFVGEVRSSEAKALYEAMRVGAASNVVAGTIHADSPFGVYDRVVNDIGVPKTSFKATDILIIANPIKSPDGIHSWKRITQITEVRKGWQDDPLAEGGFVDLFSFEDYKLTPSKDLIAGDSDILKMAGSKMRGFDTWEAIWENILLRAKIKQTMVDYARRIYAPVKDDKRKLDAAREVLLGADFYIKCNDMFHRFIEEVTTELGSPPNPEEIYKRWEAWYKPAVKIKAAWVNEHIV